MSTVNKEKYFVYAFLMFSISGTLILWFGKSDMLFFILSTLLVFYRQDNIKACFITFLLALTHFEQALVVVLIFGLIIFNDYLLNNEFKRRFLIYVGVVASLAIAKLFLLWFFWVNDFQIVESRFEFVFSKNYQDFLNPIVNNIFVYFLSIMGVFWLVLFSFYKRFSQNIRHSLIFFSVFLISMVVSMFTLDTTRVFTIVFWPFIFYMVLIIPNVDLNRIFNKKVTPVLIATALLFPTLHLKESGDKLFFGSITYQTAH